MNIISLIKKITNKIKSLWIINIYKLQYGNRLALKGALYIRKGFNLNIQNGKVEIGNNVFFNNYCSVNCHNIIQIGDNTIFGESVKLYDHDHVFNTSRLIAEETYKSAPIRIGSNCWIASNVIVLKGSTIGDNCIIGASCIVKGSIPPNTIVRASNTTEQEEIIRKKESK